MKSIAEMGLSHFQHQVKTILIWSVVHIADFLLLFFFVSGWL